MKIIKVGCSSVVDFAASELKKYLRMMSPDGLNVDITSDTSLTDGFRVGLMSDFGLPFDDVEDSRYDDVLYANCDTSGGIIAGNNPRSVLLAVYEYLRHNGCRWLYPGPSGEYIPTKSPQSVSFRIKPSCRHRGFANTTAASQETCLEFIDFLPKVGMNTFMFEFRVPTFYTNTYYDHKRNTHHRAPEHVSNSAIMKWKRAAEAEIERRGLTFHDVGHGFTIDPFGIDSAISWNQADESIVPDETRKYLAYVDGKRGLYRGVPINTNFCMSNAEARSIVADYVAKYAAEHSNVDFLHVWLSDGYNNHCECDECVKKTPSDWYMELMNDIDERMSELKLDTKIVFLAYVDTTWAPETSRIKNRDRFVFMLAPFTRAYYDSMPKNNMQVDNPPYVRNNIALAKTLESYLAYYNDWQKTFGGPAFAFEYHFCWNEFNDFALFDGCKLINDELRLYKELGIDGVVEDGDMRHFTPNGIKIYTLARTLFDTSLTVEDIVEDYFPYAYGENWREFYSYFKKLGEYLEYKYFSKQDSAEPKVSLYYNPRVAEKLAEIGTVIEEGRALIRKHMDVEERVQTVSMHNLEFYLDLCEGIADVMRYKALADDDGARAAYEKMEYRFGEREAAVERYFNHCFFFNYLHYIVYDNSSKIEFVP